MARACVRAAWESPASSRERGRSRFAARLVGQGEKLCFSLNLVGLNLVIVKRDVGSCRGGGLHGGLLGPRIVAGRSHQASRRLDGGSASSEQECQQYSGGSMHPFGLSNEILGDR